MKATVDRSEEEKKGLFKKSKLYTATVHVEISEEEIQIAKDLGIYNKSLKAVAGAVDEEDTFHGPPMKLYIEKRPWSQTYKDADIIERMVNEHLSHIKIFAEQIKAAEGFANAPSEEIEF